MHNRNPAQHDLSLGERVEQPPQFVHRLIMGMELAKARAHVPVRRLIGSDQDVEDIGAFADEPAQYMILIAAPKALQKILMLPSGIQETNTPRDRSGGMSPGDLGRTPPQPGSIGWTIEQDVTNERAPHRQIFHESGKTHFPPHPLSPEHQTERAVRAKLLVNCSSGKDVRTMHPAPVS